MPDDAANEQEHQAPPASTLDASIADSQIPNIITQFGDRIRAIKSCAKDHLPIAGKAGKKQMDEFAAKIKDWSIAAQNAKRDSVALESTMSELLDYVQTYTEELHSAAVFHSDILSRSLFIFGFSTFDAYIGLFLTRLFEEVPTLVHGFAEKQIAVSELLKCMTLEEVVKGLIDREVVSHTRSSYEEQLKTLGARHKLKDGWELDDFPRFVEAAYRRNLITHCDGIVNSLYIDGCKRAKYELASDVTIGSRLRVSEEYLRNALDLLCEVGTIIGHTIWRKACHSAITASEEALNQQIFVLLRRREWKMAVNLGRFAVKNKNPQGDFMPKLLTLNYAQALKWDGDGDAAMRVLDAVDWQASIRDLRLGVEVLKENYDNAAELMRKIGKEGELVRDFGYAKWPIFREFRKSPQFLKAYFDVYGIEFAERPLGTLNPEPSGQQPNN